MMMMVKHNKDSISFRIFHSDQEDKNKTIARIQPELMKKNRMEFGDILKISGQQSTFVVCLPLDTKQPTQQNIPEITFLNDSGKDIPQIFASDLVFPNIKLWSGIGSCVTVEKTELSTNMNSDKKKVTEASKVTFATVPWFAKNMGKDYQKRIDFEILQDCIITKNDRVTAPIRTENNQRPQQFSSIILDAKPESTENVWNIGKDTQFEFEDASLEVFSEHMPPRSGLHELLRVIPIVKKITVDDDIKITIPSLEIYENGSRLDIYATERLHKIKEITMPDFHTRKEMKMKQPVQRLHGIPHLNMEIHDNLGNSYSVMPGGRGGSGGSGTSFPTGEKDWEFYSTSEMSVLLMPLISPDAKQLTIIIKEMSWENHMHMQRLPPTKPPYMTKLEPNQTRMTIATGPWEFDIPINQQNS